MGYSSECWMEIWWKGERWKKKIILIFESSDKSKCVLSWWTEQERFNSCFLVRFSFFLFKKKKNPRHHIIWQFRSNITFAGIFLLKRNSSRAEKLGWNDLYLKEQVAHVLCAASVFKSVNHKNYSELPNCIS